MKSYRFRELFLLMLFVCNGALCQLSESADVDAVTYVLINAGCTYHPSAPDNRLHPARGQDLASLLAVQDGEIHNLENKMI